MSELRPITVTDECGSYSVYSKSDVDTVIEEKDRAIEFAKALTLKDIEIIKEKDKEIAELKKKCEAEKSIGATFSENGAELARWVEELRTEIESLKASHYAEMVDAGMRERRLKRALWLARAKRAEARKNYWYARSIHEGDKYLWSIDRSAVKYIGCIKRTNFDWLLTWFKVEDKCLKKAEEYK